MRQITIDGWISSIKALLASVSVDNKHFQSYSISIVPEGLKESSNKHEVDDVYMPRVVSMGPRFKGTREDLLLMEKVKLRCMLSLIHRAGKNGEGPLWLEKCCRVIWELDPEIRASYVADTSHIETLDLAKIILVDGCFLLELLISKGSMLNDQLRCRLNSTPPPAPQVLLNEDVLCDLILFENQIPMCVLLELSRTLFPNVFEEDVNNRAIRINNLALSLFGYDLPRHQTSEAPHVLDVVHFFVNTNKESTPQSSITANDHVVVDIPIRKLNPKQRSASRLLAAGIPIKVARETKTPTFMRNCVCAILVSLGNIIFRRQVDVPPPREETVVIKGLDFDFKFHNGELQIEQLHINRTTKATWRNIIAWEHHHKKEGRRSPNGKFTSAAWIFDGLICSIADVKLLKKKNVIVDHTGMSDEELEAVFHSVSYGVDHGIVDSKYVKLVTDLNIYSRAFSFIRMWRAFCNLLRSSFKLLIKGMSKTYSFLLSLVVFLTFVQTIYTILAYHRPPK